MIRRSYLFIVILLAFLGGVNSCTIDTQEPAAIFLNDTEVRLAIGESATLKVSVIPENAPTGTFNWSSSDETVVSVSDGEIHALSKGSVMIVVSSGSLSDKCYVSVYDEEMSNVIMSLNKSALSMVEGESYCLKAMFSDELETDEISWRSSNPNVANVSDEGMVKASGLGECIVYAECGDLKTECNVMVLEAPEVGNYYYSDGSWSRELNPQKKISGVIFWTGNPCLDDKTLFVEQSNCVHGLVVSHNGDEASPWQVGVGAYNSTIGTWVAQNCPEYISPLCSPDENNVNLNKILGYNNTAAMEAFNDARDNVWWPVTIIERLKKFRADNVAPDASSGWYIPSAKELSILSFGDYEGDIWESYPGQPIDTYLLVNGKLSSIDGAVQFEISDPYLGTGYYTTSSEESEQYAYDIPLDKGYVTSATKAATNIRIRYILAF